MKVLFTRFPLESAYGGAENQTLDLMKGLKDKGHAVAFLGSCPTLLVLGSQHNIPSAKLDIGPPPVSKEHLATFPVRSSGMKKRLEAAFDQFVEHGLDAVFMLSLSEKILLTPIALEKGVKVFWIEHDPIGPWLTKNPYLRKLKKLSKSVTTITVSNLSRDAYMKLGWKEKTIIGIPNGINVDHFEKHTDEFQKPADAPFLIGCVARLAREKGIDLLIQSVRDIPNVYLAIVGVGDEKESLLSLIDDGNLKDRVTLNERLGHLGGFYSSLDLFVLPSRTHDPFGLVTAEAMSMGVPVIVTDATGVSRELSSGEDSFVVKADSASALHAAISKLVEDEELRSSIAEKGKEKALRDFTVDGMVNKYDELLRK